MTNTDLKALREQHNLTQRELGRLLGYGANYISRLERGDEPLTQRFATLITAVLRKHRPKKTTHSPDA